MASRDGYVFSKNNFPIISSEEIMALRDADKKKRNPYAIATQLGGQEKLASTNAQLCIYGGSRGGGKSFALLLDALNDVNKRGFRSIIMRKEIGDLSDLIETSRNIYSEFGIYNRSKGDMTWNFKSGGWLQFGYYADSYADFHDRYQGKQYCYIGIDEITQMEFDKFKYIMTCNRNASYLRNRLIGTCNPDPDSWVARFIDWWLDDEGYPIPQRDGAIRYCFMDGDNVSSIVWGDSREEVYRQCKSTIDAISRGFEEFGDPKELFIKSVTFIAGRLADNKQLMRSDPSYLANLANQSEEQRARDLEGNWKYKSVGEEMIKLDALEKFFEHPMNIGDKKPFASCDIAVDGGDNLVLCLWQGSELNYLADIFVCRMNSKETLIAVKGKLEEWGVPETNFTYDLNGLGQLFKGFFPNAVPFINNAAVEERFKYVYANQKSQAAYMFARKIVDGELSINPSLLDQRYSGNGYENLPLRLILTNERRVIRADKDNTDRGFALPKKAVMKRLIGHSPDFIEAMLMAMIFLIKKKKRTIKGLGWL